MTEIEALRKEFDNVRKHIFGNGTEGLDERVRNVDRSLKKIETEVTKLGSEVGELRDFRKDIQSQYKGARLVIGILAALMTGGGVLFYTQVAGIAREILQALP